MGWPQPGSNPIRYRTELRGVWPQCLDGSCCTGEVPHCAMRRPHVSHHFLQGLLLFVVISLDLFLGEPGLSSQDGGSVAGLPGEAENHWQNPAWTAERNAETEESDLLSDEIMFMQISKEDTQRWPHDINSLESHCLSEPASLFRRLLHSRTGGEVCARRTTLWTVALFGFAFLQSGVGSQFGIEGGWGEAHGHGDKIRMGQHMRHRDPNVGFWAIESAAGP
eukprot:Skav226714  [mRNA]  locus=scaffold3811:176264:182224:- [translate_table: standard]